MTNDESTTNDERRKNDETRIIVRHSCFVIDSERMLAQLSEIMFRLLRVSRVMAITLFRFGILTLIWLVTSNPTNASPSPAGPLPSQSAPTENTQHTNRLAHEKSPYLLQHAHNPVDWYPWGEEAFSKARSENKPIFLSIGYSTCHWCHVMAHESFENEEVAAIDRKSTRLNSSH